MPCFGKKWNNALFWDVLELEKFSSIFDLKIILTLSFS